MNWLLCCSDPGTARHPGAGPAQPVCTEALISLYYTDSVQPRFIQLAALLINNGNAGLRSRWETVSFLRSLGGEEVAV